MRVGIEIATYPINAPLDQSEMTFISIALQFIWKRNASSFCVIILLIN